MSVPSLSGHTIAYRWRSLPRVRRHRASITAESPPAQGQYHCRESADIGPVSLPRVRRHRTSKPQGSSERVLPWQITMDQLIFASLSHTHYWYEVGMLKVPAGYYRTDSDVPCDVYLI